MSPLQPFVVYFEYILKNYFIADFPNFDFVYSATCANFHELFAFHPTLAPQWKQIMKHLLRKRCITRRFAEYFA